MEGEAGAQGTGDRITQRQSLRTGRVIVSLLRTAGGGAGVWMMDIGIVMKGTLEVRTPGANRDPGAGQGR